MHTTATEPDLRRRGRDGHRHDVTGKFNNYTMEVVQQIGSDSFDPGHGVLISKTKTDELVLRHVHLLRVGHRLAPGGHQQGRLRRGRRHAGKATIGDERQINDALVQRRPELGLLVRVRGHGQPPALLHHRQAHRRDGHPALHGRRPLARRRRPADARRRARRAGSSATPRATRPARSRSRTRAPRRPYRPARTRRTPRRSSTATSTASRRRPPAPAGRRTSRTRSRPPKFGETVTVPVYIEKAPARLRGTVTLDRDLGERSDQDRVRGLHAGRRLRSAARCRRRWP